MDSSLPMRIGVSFPAEQRAGAAQHVHGKSGGSDPGTAVTIRKLRLEDLHLLLRAQESSSHEMDSLSAVAVADYLKRGLIEGLVLDGPGRAMLVCWQRDGVEAMLTALYREGDPKHTFADLRRLLDRAYGILKEWGVVRVYACIGRNNPLFERLYMAYSREGFVEDLVRMGRDI